MRWRRRIWQWDPAGRTAWRAHHLHRSLWHEKSEDFAKAEPAYRNVQKQRGEWVVGRMARVTPLPHTHTHTRIAHWDSSGTQRLSIEMVPHEDIRKMDPILKKRGWGGGAASNFVPLVGLLQVREFFLRLGTTGPSSTRAPGARDHPTAFNVPCALGIRPSHSSASIAWPAVHQHPQSQLRPFWGPSPASCIP